MVAVGDRAGALSEDKAVRYNEWLAERRLGRVEDWLRDQLKAIPLELRRDLRPHDESRRIEIKIRQIPDAMDAANAARIAPPVGPG